MTDAPVSGKPIRKKRRILPWLALILVIAVFLAGVALAPRIMAALPAWITGGGEPQPVAALPAVDTPATQPPERAAQAPAAPPAALPAPDMAEVNRQLAELQNQVTRLQGAEAADASTAQAVTAMAAQIAHMLNQINEQQQRLSALEETSPKALLKPMAVLAVARLRQSVEQGSSYAGALGGVQRLVDAATLPEAANKALVTLDTHKTTGVISALALRDAFAARIEDIIEAEAVPENASWWDRTLARLENMVKVRPTGNVAGQDAPAIVARAETALNRGDVEKAVGELEDLSAASSKAAADWMKQAKARQNVLDAVDTLETALLDGAAPKEEGAAL